METASEVVTGTAVVRARRAGLAATAAAFDAREREASSRERGVGERSGDNIGI
jgi:hypothetical protein